MRALAAAVLALGLVIAAAIPHAHPAGHATSECALCAARHGDVAHDETPDVAPSVVHAEAVVPDPRPGPVTGAPLGAIPGQSPPAVA
jgi:hypothetical protein